MKTKNANSKGTILVVDDDLSVLETASKVLRSAGYVVFEASSGPEALELSAEHLRKIDVLLADLIMPGMTGRTLADILSTRHIGLDVIFMSGYIDASRGETMEQGLHYIQKPVNWKKLEDMIRDLQGKKKKGT
jgi:two-component system cell cycle sensor histidine kinase/response regulator CckA